MLTRWQILAKSVRSLISKKNILGGFVLCTLCVFLLLLVYNNRFTMQYESVLPPRTSTYNGTVATSAQNVTKAVQRGTSSWPDAGNFPYNVTIVSSYIDIGEFGKGNPNHKRDHRIYETWSKPFSKMKVPLVFYTDSEHFASHMATVRQNLTDLTRIIRLDRSKLWAFSLRDRIAKIYAGNYPKHWPNTVYPDYTCLTHAKFDLVLDTLDIAYFPITTPYVAWMDIGYLRNIVGQELPKYYTMQPPPDFHPQQILCGEVYPPNFSQSWKEIFRGNKNWVAGGFFLGTREIMRAFVQQYRRAVLAFLDQNESNVEQHVIYAMFTDSGKKLSLPTVEFQVENSGNWFHMGFKCMHPLNDTLS